VSAYPTDVLSVMDRACVLATICLRPIECAEIAEARAAVAELIATLRQVKTDHEDEVDCHGRVYTDIDRINAALARIGGQP
jgi:hypothetical protein